MIENTDLKWRHGHLDSPIAVAIKIIGIFAFSLLTATSCGKPQAQMDTAALDFRYPFGFGWESFDGQGKQIEDHWADCGKLIDNLNGLISSDNREYFIEKCAQRRYSRIYVHTDQVPPFFRQGEVSVEFRGKSEPVLYNYSFLHGVLPHDDPENKMRRSKHASVIRKKLKKLYGLPVSAGYFDQSSPAGFVPDDDRKPCEFWSKKNVGILLCSERVILIDGIEMSLSFIRLDRAPMGKWLRCMVHSTDCDIIFSTALDLLSGPRIDYLRILADWLGPETFSNCKSDKLEPIEKVWALSAPEKAELASVLKTHSGEDLALFAINDADATSSELPADRRDRIVLFLLKQAASQGSATAMSVIGANLLYCFRNVQQDTTAARNWLGKAAAKGDKYAMRSLALMHLLGMIDARNRIQEAKRHLEKCSKIDAEMCSEVLTALNEFIAVQNE